MLNLANTIYTKLFFLTMNGKYTEITNFNNSRTNQMNKVITSTITKQKCTNNT